MIIRKTLSFWLLAPGAKWRKMVTEIIFGIQIPEIRDDTLTSDFPASQRRWFSVVHLHQMPTHCAVLHFGVA